MSWNTIGAIGLVLPLVASCSSAPTRIFTLYVVPAEAATSAYSGPPLRLDAIHLPPALDRLEVVTDIAPGELKIDDTEHWSAPLSHLARQTLASDLVARLPPGRVIFPNLQKSPGTLGITVDVLDFKASPHGALLQASWTVSNSELSLEAVPKTVVLRLDASTAPSGAAATAQALSTLIGQLADAIIAGLTADPRS